MPSLSSLTYTADRQSGGDHQLRRDQSSQTCEYKNIKRSSSAGSLVTRTHLSLWLLKETSYLAAVQTGTLSAARIHFKDTRKRAHIRLRPYITANLFDATLPRMAETSAPRPEEKTQTFFSSVKARLLPGNVAGKFQRAANKMRPNKSWFANMTAICLCCWTSLSVMKPGGRKHMLEKSREILFNYRRWPEATDQNCCSSTAPYSSLCLRFSIHTGEHSPWTEQVNWCIFPCR